jgi:hypothetical protein
MPSSAFSCHVRRTRLTFGQSFGLLASKSYSAFSSCELPPVFSLLTGFPTRFKSFSTILNAVLSLFLATQKATFPHLLFPPFQPSFTSQWSLLFFIIQELCRILSRKSPGLWKLLATFLDRKRLSALEIFLSARQNHRFWSNLLSRTWLSLSFSLLWFLDLVSFLKFLGKERQECCFSR